MGIWRRQAFIWALKDLHNLDRIKCARKGFPEGGNSINKVTEASKCRGHLGQDKQPSRVPTSALGAQSHLRRRVVLLCPDAQNRQHWGE